MSAIESASLLGTLQIAFAQVQESTVQEEEMLTVESASVIHALSMLLLCTFQSLRLIEIDMVR
jgi:hypothetical protein